MYKIKKKTKKNNIVISTVLYEFEFNINIKFVRNQYSICTLREDLNKFIKMTNSLIINLSIWVSSFVISNKITNRQFVNKCDFEKSLKHYYKNWWQKKSINVNVLNKSKRFVIVRIINKKEQLNISFLRNNFVCSINVYSKACFIYIINIIFKNIIFDLDFLKSFKMNEYVFLIMYKLSYNRKRLSFLYNVL